MSAPDLAERVIANMGGPAQPSFAGQGWLVALNLGMMTAGFALSIMAVGWIVQLIWRCRVKDRLRDPITIYRLTFLCYALAGIFRYGGEAVALWGWDPARPDITLAAAQAKRLLDPIAAALVWAGHALIFLSIERMTTQLRKQPLPTNLWTKLPDLKRAAIVTGLCFAAAIGVVSTR